jgi:hypothetical protein
MNGEREGPRLSLLHCSRGADLLILLAGGEWELLRFAQHCGSSEKLWRVHQQI